MARISISPAHQLSPEVSITHYDQLGDPAKERFPELVCRQSATVDDRTAAGFRTCDVVKYTDYYRVEFE